MKRDELAGEARRALEPLRVSSVAAVAEEQLRKTRAETVPRLAAMIAGVPSERARIRRRRWLRKAGVGAAATLAMAAGVTLGPLMSIQETMVGRPIPVFAMARAVAAEATPIAGGEETVSVTVQMVYAIQ